MNVKLMIVLLAAVLLCGCSRVEDPYRVDTVVWIPVNPTQAREDAVESAPTEEIAETQTTEAVTQETEAVTQPPETTAPTEEKKPASSGRKPSGGNTASKKPAAETKPASTEPPETRPPETQAPETEPEETVPALYDISGYSLGSLEYAIADAINAARGDEGLGSLGLNARLSAIASCRASEISQVWSHTRPDGRHYSTVLGDYGYGAGSVAELLIYITGNPDADSLVGKWLESDSHRQSLMGGYTTVGIGIFRANGYTYICCLVTA